jgi:hypothetical protein
LNGVAVARLVLVLETIASLERPMNLGADEHGIVLHDLKGFRNYAACGRSKWVDADPEPLERTQRIGACHGRERDRLGSLARAASAAMNAPASFGVGST